MGLRKWAFAAALSAATFAGAQIAPASAETVLKAVMHSDVKIIDPIWTTAYISRNVGYMIYDTLFALDAKNEVKPQMVDKVDISADKLTYKLTLRDGLMWHDGKPVTAEDCVASIKRWSTKDVLGQTVFKTFVTSTEAADAKTIVIKLKEPTGMLLFALGKPSSNVPFMMPKRVADTPASQQISDFTGSGPFMLKKDEWKPGDKIVFVKFKDYKPRSEPASGMAGGKVVHLDRVEWLAISDKQQALNALSAGEIDYVEQPPHDLLPLVESDPNIKILPGPTGQFTLRFNSIQPPTSNEKLRQAIWYALNQEDYLKATVGNPKYYKVCKSFYPCGTPMYTDAGMSGLLTSNVAKAKELIKESGYKGEKIVMMASTDLPILTNLSPVSKQLLERVGLNIDMQSMDWQTLVARRAKKDAPDKGGWNIFHTAWVSADILNPAMIGFMAASCDKALFGWPCDKKLEEIRAAFLRAPDLAAQKKLAADAQKRAIEISTHIPLGEFTQPMAVRKNIDGVLHTPAPVFWNIVKK
ncbi:MAG: ABC transporter substrate-binding protein [Methylobacteriaceae bacterium]|nr:ABC transporter substrate-binding protein [Methylobacteriaceae bacterium]